MKAAFTTTDKRQIAQELVNRFSGSMGGWQHGSAAKRLKDRYDYSSVFAYARLPGFACADDNYGTEKVTFDDNKMARHFLKRRGANSSVRERTTLSHRQSGLARSSCCPY